VPVAIAASPDPDVGEYNHDVCSDIHPPPTADMSYEVLTLSTTFPAGIVREMVPGQVDEPGNAWNPKSVEISPEEAVPQTALAGH